MKKRLGSSKIGFETANTKKIDENKDYIDYVTPQDLKEFGFIPEFVGRFPIITNVNKLTEDDMVRILKEPKDSIMYQYKTLLLLDSCELEFEDAALRKIAKTALALNTGARGLRNIMETIMIDFMYDVPLKKLKKLTITEQDVVEKLSKRCKYKDVV